MSSETLKTVDQALAVLEHLASAPEPHTVTSLSRTFGISKPAMHRLLSTLRARGYVVRDPGTAEYRFGLACGRLAHEAKAGDSLTEACSPALRWIWRSTQETGLLAVREGARAVVVEKLDSPRPVLSTHQLGRLLPLHAVSTGKVLLAALSDDQIRMLLRRELHGYTPRTVTRESDMWWEIRAIRRDGYAVNENGFREGVSGVAAPVVGAGGRIVAAIGVCLPSMRFQQHHASLTSAVVAGAEQASKAVGAACGAPPRVVPAA